MMNEQQQESRGFQENGGNEPVFQVVGSPHLSNTSFTTRRMMIDVLIALIPLVLVAVYVFKFYAVKQLAICLVSCLAAEALFTRMRGKPVTLSDCSAAITGVILALSLPGTAPWYIGVIGSFVGIGIGKVIFGGLGMNIFNPAMVGRAFVMISFAGSMAASGYLDPGATVDAITKATPLTAFKQGGIVTPLMALVVGNTNGSLGEVSAIACLIGGIFLCLRRTASWEIPFGVIIATIILGGIADMTGAAPDWTVWHHLCGGALLFGAFYIATDPVTSPLTSRGKLIFGIGVGCFIMLLRLFSGYPEGVMFAVLFMNALTPLINRWTIPKPFGAVTQHT
jgi:electron transport complex protein RnfD